MRSPKTVNQEAFRAPQSHLSMSNRQPLSKTNQALSSLHLSPVKYIDLAGANTQKQGPFKISLLERYQLEKQNAKGPPAQQQNQQPTLQGGRWDYGGTKSSRHIDSRTGAATMSPLNHPTSVAKAAKQNFFKSDAVRQAVAEQPAKVSANMPATERYARKTFHTVRAGDPTTASCGNLGAPRPQIHSRAKSKKNDQSFDTHVGIIGISGNA